MSDRLARLVVVPSDPLAAYEREGLDWLEQYYNPAGLFREVFVLSPQERGERHAHGMTVRGVSEMEFRGALRELRPDVVRAYGGGWAADLVCLNRVTGIPAVASVHDIKPEAVRRSLRGADLVICVSKVVGERVAALGIDPARIRYLPNRVDMQVFRPRRPATAPQAISCDARRHILHVGRRTEQKNLDTLVRALVELPCDYHAVFVGQGDAGPYRAMASEQGVAERCHWVDRVANSQLPCWYSWCDCLCVPSRWEGFGIVFIEAAACGAPIVTSDIAPMNEYLRHGTSAHLVSESQEPTALAAAIRRVCEDEGYRRRLSEGAVLAAQPFERSTVDAAEAAIYQETVLLGPQRVPFDMTIASYFRRARRTAGSLARTSFAHLCRSKENWIALNRVLRGKRIDRNQWQAVHADDLKIYRDQMAWSWEETRRKAPEFSARIERSIEHAQGVVLEVGCGIGTMTRWLCRQPQVKEVVAVDAFEEPIRELHAAGLPKTTALQMGAEQIRFSPPRRFDTVLLCELIEHLYPDEEAGLLAALRDCVDSRTKYVVSVPIGWLDDLYHVRSFSRRLFKKHLQKHYGSPVGIDCSSGYSQIGWGYFDARHWRAQC